MGRVLLVDVLSILFGLGTWLCVNGLWVELPLLVQTLPEGWNLPSYLSVLIQLSNLAPLTYSCLNSVWPKIVTEKRSIYFVMVIGLATTLLLGSFWEETTLVGGTRHSTALLALVFFLASVDCSSRVLYLPFMSKFQEAYLISYFVGEGLSGFVPSVVALIQGVGGNPECRQTSNGTVEPFYPDPRFSVDVFFYFLFLFTLTSLVAFYFLNKENVTEGALVRQLLPTSSSSPQIMRNHITTYASTEHCRDSRSSNCSSLHNSGDVSVFEPTQDNNNVSKEIKEQGTLPEVKDEESPQLVMTRSSFYYLLFLQIFICFWANGVFPSVQSYSALPYGNNAYHLTITLSNIANPLICFLAFFLPTPNLKSIGSATLVSFGVSIYVMFTALRSPSPPLVGTVGGEALLICSWILQVSLFTYVRVSVATILRTMGKSGLFWCGVVTQVGSAIGSLIAFFVVNYSSLFQSYYPCT